MSAYPQAPTLVLRSTVPGVAATCTSESAHRTRFDVTTVPFPGGGPGECGECPSDEPINQAVGEVRYRSSLFRTRIHEAVCLPCLPGLLAILTSLKERPLTVALYSPCAGDLTEQVSRIDHERGELVGMLVAAKDLPMTTTMLGQLFAAAGAQLRKIAEVA